MINKILFNPFYTFVITAFIITMLYMIEWSELYPPLSDMMIYLLLSLYGITLLIGIIFNDYYITDGIKYEEKIFFSKRKIILITVLIYFGFFVEFAHVGGVPLLMIAGGSGFDYQGFGIPVFHVLLLTFTDFFSLLMYQAFLDKRKRIYFLLFMLLVLPDILMFNRGDFAFRLVAVLFLTVKHKNGLSNKMYAKISVLLICCLFVFGVMGNIRFMALGGNYENVRVEILRLGRATDTFYDSGIPYEFFWPYMYMTSSVSNLEYSYEQSNNWGDVYDLPAVITRCMIPDFISKRIIEYNHMIIPKTPLILENFNLVSIYGDAITIGGVSGLIFMHIYIIVFYIFFTVFFYRTIFFDYIISLLTIVSVFALFTNMISNAWVVFQIMFASIFLNRKIRGMVLE